MTCTEEIRSLLPVFALDALDDVDRTAVREHLEGCVDCALEAIELFDTAAAIDAAQPAPPQALWSRIVSDVRSRGPRSTEETEPEISPDLLGGRRRLTTRRRVAESTATSVDLDLLRLTSGVTRELLWLETPEDAAAIVAGLVRDLGGTVVLADSQDPESIPIDVSFGVGEPVFPACPHLSVSRILLEEVLPVVVEDARRAIASARERRRPKP